MTAESDSQMLKVGSYVRLGPPSAPNNPPRFGVVTKVSDSTFIVTTLRVDCPKEIEFNLDTLCRTGSRVPVRHATKAEALGDAEDMLRTVEAITDVLQDVKRNVQALEIALQGKLDKRNSRHVLHGNPRTHLDEAYAAAVALTDSLSSAVFSVPNKMSISEVAETIRLAVEEKKSWPKWKRTCNEQVHTKHTYYLEHW